MLVKYLGVVLDSRLSWRELVNIKVKKTHNVFGPVGGPMVQHGAEAQGGVLAVCLHHSTIHHHLCISSLVAWMSDG